MARTDTPLRYPGGKTQLTPFVIDLTRENNLNGGVYAEPFAGGAGIAWRLLLNGDMTEVWLNDADPAIFAFWDCVVNRPDRLCERILQTEVSMTEWEKQRITLTSPNVSTDELGFATFFLNRTNRSGILKAGVIGGKGQLGKYKMDCRYNKDDLIEKIQRIHLYKDVIKLSILDAKDCLKLWDQKLPKRALINIDPPYYAKGEGLYLSYYQPSDHQLLANQINLLNRPWMLTYDDAPEINDLYQNYPIYKKNLNYSAQIKRKATEILVLSPKLTPPGSLKSPRD